LPKWDFTPLNLSTFQSDGNGEGILFMKTLLLVFGTAMLLVGCSTTDNGMGGTGDVYESDAQQIHSARMGRTGALDVGTGNAGMGVGTGLGSGSTGSVQ
jgi:hypothetical protein